MYIPITKYNANACYTIELTEMICEMLKIYELSTFLEYKNDHELFDKTNYEILQLMAEEQDVITLQFGEEVISCRLYFYQEPLICTHSDLIQGSVYALFYESVLFYKEKTKAHEQLISLGLIPKMSLWISETVD